MSTPPSHPGSSAEARAASNDPVQQVPFPWVHRSVLVTGATGLLGSHLVSHLVERGARVGALVRDYIPDAESKRAGSLAQCWQVHGAIEDFDLLERTLNEHEVDTVFHLAAQTIVGTAHRNPRSTFEANIRGTYNLLEACRRVSTVRRVIVASSDKAYGDHGPTPYTEEQALQGRHPYDVSKSCADLIAQAYFVTYGLPVCITRCGNLFGGGDLNFNRLVPGTIRALLRGEAPIVRSDGRFVRDYFYVRDAVLAYVQLAERMEAAGVCGEAFNFSNDQPLTVLDMVERLRSVTGREDLTPVILNEVRHEIHSQALCSAKAQRLLGWKPRYALDEALAETVAWYRAHAASQLR